MASCRYCSTTILFGGVQDGNDRFCNNQCYQSYLLISIAQQIPPHLVREQVNAIHQGLCPKCGGSGPVDLYRVYKVWSAFFLTSWSHTPQISCRSCATRSQAGGIAFCLVLGWWGIPWGLIFTPVQVIRNLIAMCRSPNPLYPSPELENFVKVHLAAQLVEQEQQAQTHSIPT